MAAKGSSASPSVGNRIYSTSARFHQLGLLQCELPPLRALGIALLTPAGEFLHRTALRLPAAVPSLASSTQLGMAVKVVSFLPAVPCVGQQGF